jgi:low affinity Fe/Cu permease
MKRKQNGEHDGALHVAKSNVEQQLEKERREGGRGFGVKTKEVFHEFARKAALAVGSPWAFLIAVVVIVLWGASGPLFKWSDTWQLVINTGTTIVTFLMVFLIQNTQNRDARAMHLKLDELIRALHGPRNTMVDLEDASDEELDRVEREFRRVRERGAHGRGGRVRAEEGKADRKARNEDRGNMNDAGGKHA